MENIRYQVHVTHALISEMGAAITPSVESLKSV
jgi:hypothetical protein